MCIVFVDAETHWPSVVPRTEIETGLAPRFAPTSLLQETRSSTSSQPPDG
jgi:hypothetical protein